jgi:peroxiredoxin
MIEKNILVGNYAPDFEIPGTDGEVHHLGTYLEKYQAIAVVFMGNKCPHVNAYLERLKQIQNDFSEQGFTLVGINANDAKQSPEDDFEKMKIFAQAQNLNFPYLRDTTQDVARSFQATNTPEVFLINKQWTIVYQGQIDDNFNNPQEVKNAYLKENINALLTGETIKTSFTDPLGCEIKLRSRN